MRAELVGLIAVLAAAGLFLGLRGALRGRRLAAAYLGALLLLAAVAAALLAFRGPSPRDLLHLAPTETVGPTATGTSRASPSPAPPPSATSRALRPSAYLPQVAQGESSFGTLASPTPTPTSTPTPAPTSTPAPPVPTPTPLRPAEKVTKMGVGVYGSGGSYIPPLLRAKPTVILLMEPKEDFARDVRRWFPKAFIVGRRLDYDQPLDNPQERGEAFADYVAALAVPLKGVVDAWTSYCEAVNSGNYERYKAYNAFQVAFARKLQDQYGVAAVAGNDGVGVVQPEDYPKYFAEAIQESRYFGVHAYAPQNARTMQQDAEWYALRYRRIYQALEAAGVKHGPFVITESGLWAGWRGVVSEAEMARDYIWFTDELEKDPYVIGHAAYGFFGNGQWDAFDFVNSGTMLDALGDYWPAGR